MQSLEDKSIKYFKSGKKCRIACNKVFDLDKEDKKETNEVLNDKAKSIIILTLTDRVIRNLYKDTASEK